MCFPKHSKFQISLLPIFFSANPYFLKPNYFRSSSLIGEKAIRILYFLFSRTGNTLLLYSSERRGTKINLSQIILSSLSVDAFLHFAIPMMFNIGMFQWINIRKTKLPNKLNKRTKTNAIVSQLYTPKTETLIKLQQKINFHCKAVVSRDFQTPIYPFW